MTSIIRILNVAALILASAGAALSQTGMRMYVFDCATLKDRDPGAYGLTRDQVASVDMSDPCFLIVHPKGKLLWDTGLNDAMYDRPEGGGAKHDKIDKSLRSQLAAIGYGPADITYLAMSHAHGDHSGNANDYAGSTWIVQKTERDFMFSDAAAKTSAKPDQYSKLKDSKTIVIDGDYDVFGDKSVTLISTPGHTPGHQCLLVRLPKTGPVLLSGDLYHFPGEREFHTFPTGSNADYVASRAKVEALLKSTGAQLWIQHDMISNHKLKKSPQYYE
jgi:N-acyl homoserine lactone hydrolase